MRLRLIIVPWSRSRYLVVNVSTLLLISRSELGNEQQGNLRVVLPVARNSSR